MKKVLFIITRLASGGAPAVTLTLLKALRDDGYDVELATGLAGKGEKDLLPKIQNGEFPVTVIPELVRNIDLIKDFIALRKLRKLIKEKAFDVVHTHTTKAGIIGRLAAHKEKVAHIIHSPHGHIFHSYINPVLIDIYIWLERMAAVWSQKIIVLTEKEKKECLALGIGKSNGYQCIYNGIETEKYYDPGLDVQAERQKMNISPSATVLINVGRLVPVKGHQYFLKAAASMIHSDMKDIHCLIVGDGVLRATLEQMARDLDISDRVTFLGNQENVTPFLMISDLFVLPSLNEGFGLVIVEAMASGLPIVAAHVGGVPEIVIDGETGRLVDPEDSDALKDGVLDLLKDRTQLEDMGNRNRARAQNEFSLEQMNAKLKQLYREMLTEK